MTHQTPDALNIGISFDALRMFLSLHATDPDADLDAAVEACEAQVKRAVEQRLDAAESRAREVEQERDDARTMAVSRWNEIGTHVAVILRLNDKLTELEAAKDAAESRLVVLEEALRGVKSTARGFLCWCDASHNAVEYGHQPKCLAAEAALSPKE